MSAENIIEVLRSGLSKNDKVRAVLIHFNVSHQLLDIDEARAISEGDIAKLHSVVRFRNKVNRDIIEMLGKEPNPIPGVGLGAVSGTNPA